jgi:cytochrome c oxidase subunit 2
MIKKSVRVHLVSVSFAVALVLAYILPQKDLVLAQDQATQIIELSAKKYEYSPSPVHIKAGTRVQLKITATDHDHGFKIALAQDGDQASNKPGLVFATPQDCWLLKKGETTTIEFTAQMAGTYSFKCCHTCGIGHRGMKSQLIVD